MRRGYQQERPHAKFDLVEWAVVTLILAIAFFAILQVVGEELRTTALGVWQAVLNWVR